MCEREAWRWWAAEGGGGRVGGSVFVCAEAEGRARWRVNALERAWSDESKGNELGRILKVRCLVDGAPRRHTKIAPSYRGNAWPRPLRAADGL